MELHRGKITKRIKSWTTGYKTKIIRGKSLMPSERTDKRRGERGSEETDRFK